MTSTVSDVVNQTNGATELSIDPNIDKIWGSLGLLMGALTIVGNVLVLVVLLKLSKRSLSDAAFINLAVIDTVSGVAGIAGAWFLLNNRKWLAQEGVWMDITCYAAGMMWNTASLTTPLLVSVVSIGRLAAVYLPLSYDKFFTQRVVLAMLTYCWVHGAVAASLGLWGHPDGKYALFEEWGYCDQSVKYGYPNETVYKALYLSFFTIPMTLTCSCIVLCNMCVMVRIVKMKLNPGPEIYSKASTVSLSNAEVMKHKIEKIGRRISTAVSTRLSLITLVDQTEAYQQTPGRQLLDSDAQSNGYNNGPRNSQVEITLTPHNGGIKPEFCETETYNVNGQRESLSTYKHFEVVSEADHDADNQRQSMVSCTTTGSVKRRQSKVPRIKNIQRLRRARRENRAILMTFLVSVSYLICYMEIINFYILAPFVESPSSLFDKILGVKSSSQPQSVKVKTYLNLWYYYSLFTAAATNVLLHFLFNHVVRSGFRTRSSSTQLIRA